LDARYPEPRLIPLEPVARARVQALAQLIACDIHPLNNLRVLRYLRTELALDEAAVKRWYQHWVADAFDGLETLVARTSGGRYAFGEAVSIVDVCLVPQVYNARRFDCDLAPTPRSCALWTACARSPHSCARLPSSSPTRSSFWPS
jgi:maleylacetoacetate isomerase